MVDRTVVFEGWIDDQPIKAMGKSTKACKHIAARMEPSFSRRHPKVGPKMALQNAQGQIEGVETSECVRPNKPADMTMPNRILSHYSQRFFQNAGPMIIEAVP